METATETGRRERLLPNGEPRWIRAYDDGGETFDRYTVVYTGHYQKNSDGHRTEYEFVGMSANPFHPQGFGQHGATTYGPCDTRDGRPPAMGRKGYLGRRIAFRDLPPDCQQLVLSDYRTIWGLTA